MYKIRALIADDENQARQALVDMLGEFCPEVEIFGLTKTIEESVNFISQNRVDIAFLDLRFGNEGLGFDILEKLKRYYCEIVFVTAHSDYALRSFEYDVLNYILKPVSASDLLECIARYKKRKNKPLALPKLTEAPILTEKKFFTLPMNGKVKIVETDMIEYIEGNGSYTNYHFVGGTSLMLARNIKYFEKNNQDTENFIRIHKSYLVNKKYIQFVKKGRDGFVEMKSGAKIKFSMSYKNIIECLHSK